MDKHQRSQHANRQGEARLPRADTAYEKDMEAGCDALERSIAHLDSFKTPFPSMHAAKFATVAMQQMTNAIALLAAGDKREGTVEFHSAAIALEHARRETEEFNLGAPEFDDREPRHLRFETALDLVLHSLDAAEGSVVLGDLKAAKRELRRSALLAVESAKVF